MNIDNFNKWLALLANIGVIAGIVFLAVEVGQFRGQMQSQNNYDYFNALTTNLSAVSQSPFLSEIIAKLSTGEALSPAENVSADNFINSIFLFWEYVWRETEAGRFDEGQLGLNAIVADFNHLRTGPYQTRFNARWVEFRGQLEPGLVAILEQEIADE